jgi:hypothetical protein
MVSPNATITHDAAMPRYIPDPTRTIGAAPIGVFSTMAIA